MEAAAIHACNPATLLHSLIGISIKQQCYWATCDGRSSRGQSDG
jgi:hypothetical protein